MINFIFEQFIPNRPVTHPIFYKCLTIIFGLSLILLFPTSGWSFETNHNSKISADLEVTGALKLTSVDSSSTGIVTSITDSSNSTLPTTGAVKAYIDAQVAASSSSSSGSNPITISPSNNSLTNLRVAFEYCAELTLDGGGWRLPTVDEFMDACARDEACKSEGTDGVFYRTATPVLPSAGHPYASPPWPDWVMASYWKLDAQAAIYDSGHVRCVK